MFFFSTPSLLSIPTSPSCFLTFSFCPCVSQRPFLSHCVVCALQFINEMSRGEGSWWNSNILSDLFPVKGQGRGDELSLWNGKKERRHICASLQRVCCNNITEGRKEDDGWWARWTLDTENAKWVVCILGWQLKKQSKACFPLFYYAEEKQGRLFIQTTETMSVKLTITFIVKKMEKLTTDFLRSLSKFDFIHFVPLSKAFFFRWPTWPVDQSFTFVYFHEAGSQKSKWILFSPQFNNFFDNMPVNTCC